MHLQGGFFVAKFLILNFVVNPLIVIPVYQTLKSSKKISSHFLKLGIVDFMEACNYVKNLPYKRNRNKADDLCVLSDLGGTCSTKHAILKNLATENNFAEVDLMLCIFRMNAENTTKIAAVLSKYFLKEIPEAHNYLKIENEIFDSTTKNSRPENFINDLVLEIEIQPAQINDFKIEFHQNYLLKYLQENPEIPYSLEEFWKIREECISALQH